MAPRTSSNKPGSGGGAQGTPNSLGEVTGFHLPPSLLPRPFSTDPPFTSSLPPSHRASALRPLSPRPHTPARLHNGLPAPSTPNPRPHPPPGLLFLTPRSPRPPSGSRVPRRPPGLPGPSPGRRRRCGTAPGLSTPARGRYHARASEQLGRLGPLASKNSSDWPGLSREGGARGGSHPFVAGAPVAFAEERSPQPARCARPGSAPGTESQAPPPRARSWARPRGRGAPAPASGCPRALRRASLRLASPPAPARLPEAPGPGRAVIPPACRASLCSTQSGFFFCLFSVLFMSFIQELLTEHLFQEPRVLGAADKSPGLAGPGVHTCLLAQP